MATVFRETLEFFGQIGIYDVVLPFLLIFTIVFAILEKSKVFGTVSSDGTTYTKKNLNAMFAFVTSFFVVGSAQLVAVINQAVSQIVLLLMLSILFMILAGSFNKDEEFFLQKGWNKLFMIIMFIGVVLIFTNALGWLDDAYFYVTAAWSGTTLSSIILILFIVLFIYWVTKDPGSKSSHSNGNGNGNGSH